MVIILRNVMFKEWISIYFSYPNKQLAQIIEPVMRKTLSPNTSSRAQFRFYFPSFFSVNFLFWFKYLKLKTFKLRLQLKKK